jgi:YidC/Oxa1 family membrane protein insertase
MERRVLLFIFLSLVILYGFQALFVPTPPPAEVTAPAAPATPPPGAAPSAPAALPQPAPVETPATQTTAITGDTEEREIRVETDEVVAIFTNRGARLKSWRLKAYFEHQEPLELVAQNLGDAHPLPFSLAVPDEATTRVLNSALYATIDRPPPGASAASAPLTFEYRDTSGLAVVKTFQFEAPYVVSVAVKVSQEDRGLTPIVQWGPALAGAAAATSYALGAAGLVFMNGELERLSADDIAAQPGWEGEVGYAGVDEHYFMTAAIQPGRSRVVFGAITAPPAAGSTEARNLVSYTIEPSAPDRVLTFFVGPKDFDVLASVDRDLVRAINFGMFAFLVVPLLRSLNWIQGFIGNYGWSIVLLTVLINAVMFPLRHKSVVSMRRMQEIQPEAKAIQERYAKLKATDPAKQKMNQELMGLYRERGVNPASGCVPMLLTLPVLLAFYSLLTVAIELRGAPFVGWIQDLSAPDPFYVTPVLMGLSQLWQTWMTPQTGVDPAQQKLMMLMPVMFMVFFLWAPSGVVLYWLISNLWGIGQTYLTNYIIGPPKVHTVRPPAERRTKRVGSGKTEAAARETES